MLPKMKHTPREPHILNLLHCCKTDFAEVVELGFLMRVLGDQVIHFTSIVAFVELVTNTPPKSRDAASRMTNVIFQIAATRPIY